MVELELFKSSIQFSFKMVHYAIHNFFTFILRIDFNNRYGYFLNIENDTM